MPTTFVSSEVRFAPVLAVVVCRDTYGRLRETLSALRSGPVRPRHVLLATTVANTSGIVTDAVDEVEHAMVDGVLHVSEDTSDAEAVALAVDHARQRWDDLGEWVWPLYDGRLPEADCLASLVEAAEAAPSTAVLTPFPCDGAEEGQEVQKGQEGEEPGRGGETSESPDMPGSGALVPLALWGESSTDGPLLCVPGARLRGVFVGDGEDHATSAVEEVEPVEGIEPVEGPAGRLSRSAFARWLPPAVLTVALAVVALALNAGRLGLELAGGALLPVGDLGQVWREYLAAWHGVAGGTASAAPTALAVLGVLGAPLEPLGGPAALVALLLIGDVPLAALSAYLAMRRTRARRWVRAGLAAAYGLLPPATAAVASGRVDVVVVHVLLPAVLAGTVAVGYGPLRSRWLGRSVVTALGVAVVSAFAPFGYLLLTAVAVITFVVAPVRRGPRTARAGGLAVLVLLPLALSLPWLPTLVSRPALVVHGLGGPATVEPSVGELLGLDPGGPGGSVVGLVVLLAAAAAVAARRSVRMVPAGGLVLLGVFGVAGLSFAEAIPVRGGDPAPGFVGVPLLFAGAGLLAVVLAACVPERAGEGDRKRSTGPTGPTSSTGLTGRSARPVAVRLIAAGGATVLLVLAVGDVLAGHGGPVRKASEPLEPSLSAELAATGRGVLVLGDPDDPGDTPRLTAGRAPRFGDDALVPVGNATSRLTSWQQQLLAGSREAVTSVAAAGVLFVVLPEGENGHRLRQEAGDLVTTAPPTADGRTVLRLTPTAGTVTLTSWEQARRSVSGEAPDAELMTPPAAVVVEAVPPEVGVRVSEGPEGRLLVLSSVYEPGWRATVDGDTASIVLAWGRQVAVAVPPEQSDVRVVFDSNRHDLLLLGQLAAVLFTLFTILLALPSRSALAGLRRSARRSKRLARPES